MPKKESVLEATYEAQKVECRHKDCQKPAVSNGNGFCRHHLIESREKIYLDNTDINNLGIVQWAKDFLPHYMPNKVPKFHPKIYHRMLSLYHPTRTRKMERLLNLVSWRGSAKSTLVNLIFPAYILAHNGKDFTITVEGEVITCRIRENFICVVSETGDMAEDFVVRLRDEFLSNNKLRYFYRFIIQDAIEERTGQMTRKAFKINDCFVLGVGSGMQIRGRIKGAYRVTLLILDDIYSEKKVKTDKGRASVRNWFNSAVKYSVDDLLGKIANLGTILHEDTIHVDLIRNDLWQNEMIYLMPLELFEDFLNNYMEMNESTGECKLPFDDIKNEYERIDLRKAYYDKIQAKKDWKLSWPERVDLYSIALLIADAVRSRTLALLYQEYLHEVVPNASKRFRKEYFQPLPEYSIIKNGGETWFDCPTMYSKPVPIKIRIGLDTASGTIDGDDSVCDVTGILPDNRWIKFQQIFGKFGMRDETYDNTAADLRYGRVITDRKKVRKIGYIDEAFRLAVQWGAQEIIVGYAGNELTLVTETQKIFMMNNSDCLVYGRKQIAREGLKAERIATSLYSHYSTYSVWHAKGLHKLEHQLEYLESTKNDDCADAAEVACYNAVPPSWAPFNPESGKPAEPREDPRMLEARAKAMRFFKDKIAKLNLN